MADAFAGGLPTGLSTLEIGGDRPEWITVSSGPKPPQAKPTHIIHEAELELDGPNKLVTMQTPARDTPEPPTANAAPTQFPLFPFLPAELRQDIWALSLTPRVVELHRERRTHYADDEGDRTNTPKWQSRSANPAILAVCAEARAIALRAYTVALPLATAPSAVEPPRLGTWSQRQRPGNLVVPMAGGRRLYVAPSMDMVIVLGDLQYPRLSHLLGWFREQDGLGLRRLGLSVGPFAQEMGGLMLRMYSQTVFARLEEFVLFMYVDLAPPAEWRTGTCVLKECCDADDYKRFVVRHGDQFRHDEKWMVVGQGRMKVLDLRFAEGWSV